MTYLEKKSKVDGPAVWLVGGLHGDEPGGSAVIKKLFAELEKIELLKGSLHAFPFVNESGLEKKTRELPETGEDLNRLFPGQSNGTDGQKIVSEVWQAIIETKPSLVLDLHNDWIKSVPYILIDDESSIPIALASGLIVVRENPKFLETLAGTLSLSLVRAGIPALTLELGGAYVVDEKNVRIGVNAISRILVSLGLITKEIFPIFDVKGPLTSSVCLYSDEPRPTTTGQIKMFVEPGQIIKKGDLIAKIESQTGEILEELFARQNAIVLGFTDETISRPGQEVVALGLVN